MTFDLPDEGPGRRMRYPYGVLGKLFGFPFKHYWKYGRAFRYTVISVILTAPIIYPIHKAVNSPGNVEAWREIRAKRPHDPFALPTLDGKHH